jgi:hypothetical protein
MSAPHEIKRRSHSLRLRQGWQIARGTEYITSRKMTGSKALGQECGLGSLSNTGRPK